MYERNFCLMPFNAWSCPVCPKQSGHPAENKPEDISESLALMRDPVITGRDVFVMDMHMQQRCTLCCMWCRPDSAVAISGGMAAALHR